MSTMVSPVLQDVALVSLIFSYLSISELLKAERVCILWRAIINSDPTLLQRLYLRPGSLAAHDATLAGFNRLLLERFPLFLHHGMPGIWVNRFTTGLSNGGPFTMSRFQDCMVAEGKWRRMSPCYPPVTRLVVHLVEKGKGEVAWMDFSNTQDSSKEIGAPRSCPNWLTFGLVFDVIEAAWFQGMPHYTDMVTIIYPDFGGPFGYGYRGSLTRSVPGHESLDCILAPGDGKVVIEIHLDTTSGEERQQQHEKARDDEAEKRRRNRGRRGCMRQVMKDDKHIYTNEFHFANGLSFDDIT